MLTFFICLLTVVLVLDCLFLVLLVLVQLPKKEAGMGQAFGGAATDALFGAGSGNFLTKATKWAAGILFALSLLVSILQSAQARHGNSEFQRLLKEQQSQQAPVSAPPVVAPSGSNATMPENPAPSAPLSIPAMPAASNAAPPK